MKQRIRLTVMFFIGALLTVAVHDAQAESLKPNVLLILLDDAGWTDLGCYGSRVQTPNIDELAAQGMRFTDCHSAAPNCSPSRAGLLTGRTPSRVGVYSYLPADHVMHLRSEEVTLAELLKTAGYRTGHFGKWHLSRLQSDQPGPLDQGFDYSLGTDNNAHPSHKNPDNFIRNRKPVGIVEGYSCQIVVDEANQWLADQSSDQPFFACVWFHEPHTPIASPPELIAKYQQLYPGIKKKEATYLANIENVDHAVGRLLGSLESSGQANNTLVFLTSDNGPLNRFSREGLRGKKSNVWEGGHRVPGIFRWPEHIATGTTCREPISGVDFLPTVCDVVGIPTPQDRHIDGTSLVPLFRNASASLQRSQPLYWFFYRLNPAIAIRDGHWSLVCNSNDRYRPKAHGMTREDMPKIRESRPDDYQLFDLRNDLHQQVDVSQKYPHELARLRAKMNELHHNVVQEGYQWNIPAEYGRDRTRKLWNSE